MLHLVTTFMYIRYVARLPSQDLAELRQLEDEHLVSRSY